MRHNISLPIALVRSKSGFTAKPRLRKVMKLENGALVNVNALCGQILGFGEIAEDLIAPESPR
jgi:hypothetical protein